MPGGTTLQIEMAAFEDAQDGWLYLLMVCTGIGLEKETARLREQVSGLSLHLLVVCACKRAIFGRWKCLVLETPELAA